MSFGAGGLAQMTFNNHNGLNANMGLPASGLSSRGANMKRLTISAPSPNDEVAQAPKSSRAQLLSGLRTQKNNASTIPGTAPATQTQFPMARKQSPSTAQNHLAVPQTATGASFSQNGQQLNVPGVGPRGHHYTPSQVLSPPSITLESDEADGQLDPSYYQELLLMNQHLAQQQERLKQQLVAVTQQAQQMGLNPQQAQYYAQMMAQQAGLYTQPMQQQQQQQMVEAVPGQPGLFIITNPMTGQSQYYYDQNAALQMSYGMDVNDQGLSHSPPPATPTYNKTFEQPAQTNNHAKSSNWRSSSPPKNSSTPPTDEPVALPPQGANAWRPGHKKSGSLMPQTTIVQEAPKPAPAAQGNFGPGQNREGEHPIRQPRGPPSLDELTAKPTSLYEGSKNFASRQRRAALDSIVSAGAARRSYNGSNASLSPTSERDELVFSSAEDNDTASIRSGGSIQRAIGSEKKEREERQSRERERKDSFEIEAKSVSSEEGIVDVSSRMGSMGLGNKETRRSAIIGLKGATNQRASLMF